MSDSQLTTPRPAEWVLADCPACGKTMKLRRELVGKHALLCPSCRAPIAIEFANDTPAVPSTPAAEQPSHLPRSRKAAFESASPSFSGNPRPQSVPPREEPAGYQKLPAPRAPQPFMDANPASSGEKRVLPPAESKLDEQFIDRLRLMDTDLPARQKKRRRRGPDEVRLADWDTLSLTEIPEAELRADEWSVPGPDLLQPETMVPKILRATAEPVELITTEEGLMVERKRTRKGKRKVFFGQEFVRRLSGTGRWVLLSIILLIGGAALWFLMHTFPDKAKVSASEAGPQKASSVSLEERTGELSFADVVGGTAVVRKFLAADGWAAKSEFVRRQNKVKPLMEQWYITHPATPLTCEDPDDLFARKVVVGNTYIVYLGMRVGPEKVLRFFAIEHVPPIAPNSLGTYLVDWETSIGYQPIELRDYMVKQPREPFTFRVLCMPKPYYNYGFSDQDKWISYELTYPGDPDFRLYGYVPKESALAEELGRQLLLEANIMVQLRYPENPISREQVIIEKIVHPTWFYDRDEVVPLSRTAAVTK